jgi:hypothetical protein
MSQLNWYLVIRSSTKTVRGIPAPRDDDDEADHDTYDQYVGAKVVLPKGDAMMNAKVRGRKCQADVTLLGKAHANTILDTRTYEVEFADGQLTEIAANVIAGNMFAQCDSKGNQYLLVAGIVDHRKDSSAVEKSDMYIKRGSNLQYVKPPRVGACVLNGRTKAFPGNHLQV